MNLKFDLNNTTKDSNLIQEFSNELTDSLEKLENQSNLISAEDVEKEYKLDSDSISDLKAKRNELLQSYSKELDDDEKLYYISYKNILKNTYQILEYDNTGEYSKIFVSADDLPENVTVGQILKKASGEFVLNEVLTKNLVNDLSNVAESLLNEQNIKLDSYRKEEQTYRVVDFSLNGIYLQDMETYAIFEETSISEELYDKISNDYILRYENGEYIYDEDLTKNYME